MYVLAFLLHCTVTLATKTAKCCNCGIHTWLNDIDSLFHFSLSPSLYLATEQVWLSSATKESKRKREKKFMRPLTSWFCVLVIKRVKKSVRRKKKKKKKKFTFYLFLKSINDQWLKECKSKRKCIFTLSFFSFTSFDIKCQIL